MIDFGSNPERPKSFHRCQQLRNHQIVDAPVLAARGLDPSLSDQDRIADAFDAPHEAGIDMKNVLIEYELRSKIFDLGHKNLLHLRVEPGAQSDLTGQRPQHRLERLPGTLQPAGKRGTLDSTRCLP